MGALDYSLLCQPKVAPAPLINHVDAPANTVWVTLRHDPRRGVHNFSLPLLHDLHASVQALQSSRFRGGEPVHYAVMRSDHPDYFNAGGDLQYFRRCIGDGNRQGLYQYSMLCLEVLMGWAACADSATSTVALVQGRALGGGFEAALAADHLIAEEHSSFGFPEIMFGLFPCTGAMSLLARRVGPGMAERMMTNGKIYSAAELHEMGIVDVLCARGEGEKEAVRFVGEHARHRRARQAVERCRKRQAPLARQELALVVEEWVDLAVSLDEQALRVMDMLIMMQAGAGPVVATGTVAAEKETKTAGT